MPYNNYSELSNFHIHLTGAHNVKEIRSLAAEANVSIDKFEPLEEEQFFESYNYWASAKELTSTDTGLLLAIKEVLDKEKEAGVSYVEITINPYGMVRRGLDISSLVEQLERAYLYGESIGVLHKIKFGVNRKDGVESVSSVMEVFERTPEHLRFGIDLNGDELKYPTDEFVSDFRSIRSQGVSTTIHAGEHTGTEESLLHAISANPTRICHAVAANKAPRILDQIKENFIEIEVAITSNLALGRVACLSLHPILDFIEYDIPVVFGTDDPGLFGNTMQDEISYLKKIGLSESEIQSILGRSIYLRA